MFNLFKEIEVQISINPLMQHSKLEKGNDTYASTWLLDTTRQIYSLIG